jgi:hypothetical protein
VITDKTTKGELTVSGENHAKIILQSRPCSIEVKFLDQQKHHPCHPHHHDSLSWRLNVSQHKFILVIEWHVFDTRQIIYTIDYNGS